VKLANYIHELLLSNETVIIPGLGAFISIYKPAEISGNEIKPPSKEISFTQQIKNNDGLLVTTIARKAKISQPNALKRIDRERENVLYQLDKGEKVVIESVGILFYDEKNEIQFTPFSEDNLLLDSFGLETISLEDTVEKTVVTESAADLAEQVEPSTDIEEETESVSEKPIEKIKLPDFKPASAIDKPAESKKTSWYWYLLILIPILIAGYFVFSDKSASLKPKNNQVQPAKIEQQEVQIQSIPPLDSMQTDSVQKPIVDSVKNAEPQVNLQGENQKYYLVGGGFKNEENVEKYILILKEKGIVGINLGKKGSMYLVGIAAFDNEAEAFKALNEHLKTDPGWNLWVYKK
jgi:hypothetical protein